MLPNACASNVCKAMMALAESEEGRHALLSNAGTMFHIKRQMMSDDDSVCSDASLLYLALQEQADGRSSSIALPRAIVQAESAIDRNRRSGLRKVVASIKFMLC